MKRLLFLILLLPLLVSGTNYYVSNTGNDSNTGTTTSAPWRTISKVNTIFSSLSPGDNILFKRGDTFVGELVISRSGTSGARIVIGAYGSGADPIISGLSTLSSFADIGGGIQRTYAYCKASVNILNINGVPQKIGRWPNTGWNIYETFSTKVSITDNELTGTPDWTGAELVVRKNHWIIDRAPITNHTTTTLTYTSPSNYNGTANYGYFVQKSLSTLDQFGEWYFDGTYMNIYFGANSPSSYTIKTSILDTLVYATNKSYITFDNITFEGANLAAFYLSGCTGFTIQNCSILYTGRDAIYSENCSYLTVDRCSINYAMNTSIDMDTYGGSGTNATITNNTIKNSGVYVGMDKGSGDGCNFGLSIQVPKSRIQYNSLDSCGYHGIIFVEDSTLVQYNLVDHFCLVKDDGSGIYTYQQTATPVFQGRVVSSNIVLNGYGNETGTADGLSQANGIYMDGYTQNVTISDNTVYNCNQSGLFLGWFSSNISIINNLFYANALQVLIERHTTALANYSVKYNKFVSRDVEENMIRYTATIDGTPPWILGTWDSNYYVHPCGDDAVFVGDYTYGAKRYIKGFTYQMFKDTYDKHAFADITNFTAYNAVLGSNKFVNGGFDANVNGASLSYAGTAAFAWDNTNKIDGGSLRLYYTTLATTSNSTNIKLTITDVDSTKNYVAKISTLGTSGEHMANVHLRQSISPYAYLSPIQYIKIGTTVNNAEILFRKPTTGSAYLYVVVDDSTGTCYIDNVGVYEVSVADKNLNDYLFFDYTTVAKTTVVPAHFVDLDGNPVGTMVAMAPYTSVLYTINPTYKPRYTITRFSKVVDYKGRVNIYQTK